jgi:hypothetical protein
LLSASAVEPFITVQIRNIIDMNLGSTWLPTDIRFRLLTVKFAEADYYTPTVQKRI